MHQEAEVQSPVTGEKSAISFLRQNIQVTNEKNNVPLDNMFFNHARILQLKDIVLNYKFPAEFIFLTEVGTENKFN